jgi:protein TonB
MFDAVLQRGIPRRQLGRGAVASIVVHAGVLLGVLYISAGPRVVEKPDGAVLRFVMPAPPPPLAGKASEPSKAKPEPKRPTPPKDAVVPTKPVAPKPVEETSNAPPSDQASDRHEGSGTGDAPPGAGDPSGKPGGEPNAPPATSSTTVLPMLPGMERPSILSRGSLTYSREAMAARSEGTALARCVVNLDGSLSDCRITKSVPFMDRPILEMLQATRYSCVMYQGHCQRVEMVIPVRVAPPR